MWTLDGLAFPSDPTTWISEVVGNGGVNPYPDGLDTRAFRVAGDRLVAVVSIPPVSTPPCNTGGRVYERVSGRTIPVREPLRLAALFERGDQARIAASTRANAAAKSRCCGQPCRTRPHSYYRTCWIDKDPVLHYAPFSPHYVGLTPPRTSTTGDRNPRRCWGLDLVRSWPR